MILHNQRGASVSWEADGTVYKWEPYGACELPDNLVPLIKSEGFPVDVTSVTPKERAQIAASLASDSEVEQALEQTRKSLALAETRLLEAKSAAEAADLRAGALRTELDAASERLRVSEQELQSLRSDSGEYEKMVADGQGEIARLKERVKVSEELEKMLADASAELAKLKAPAEPKKK